MKFENLVTLENAERLAQVIRLKQITIEDAQKWAEKFIDWWPVSRQLLTIAKIFTNDKTDAVIDAIIKAGDILAEKKAAEAGESIKLNK